MSSRPEPTSDEAKLAALLELFEESREHDVSVGVGSLRGEAGELFPELADLAECLGILDAGLGGKDRPVPASFGPYDIEAELGSGVSGVVYRAAHDGQTFALKVMRESVALSAAAMTRFRREIDVARQLDHPHIVRVLEHGEVKGRLYFAMELVDGCSLAALQAEIESCGEVPSAAWLEILDRFGVPAGEGKGPAEIYARRMAALFVPIADALAHAHRNGLVHRDLKPGNLLLGRDGKLRITDFGLAKVLGEEITTTVAVLGTPGFMSPEQAAGLSKSVDARSDLYGLGASLYHMLTLHYPVDATSFSEMLAAILTQKPPRLTAHCSSYPRGLELVLSRCLEKERADRYPDAGALARDLERVAQGRAPRIGRVPLPRRFRRYVGRHRKQAAAIATAVVLCAILLGWLAWAPVALSVEAVPGGQLALDGTILGDAPWSGDVSRGAHQVQVTRERFVTVDDDVQIQGATRLVYHLRPLDPFGELPLLARTYGVKADLPPAVRPRALSDEPLVLEKTDPGALAERLRAFPADVRDAPFARLFAIRRLLDDGLCAEAYEAASELATEHPGRSEPRMLALAALHRLGFEDRREYARLFAEVQEAQK